MSPDVSIHAPDMTNIAPEADVSHVTLAARDSRQGPQEGAEITTTSLVNHSRTNSRKRTSSSTNTHEQPPKEEFFRLERMRWEPPARPSCHICHQPYNTGRRPEIPFKLPCGHEFGGVCISKWLHVPDRMHGGPMCREDFFKEARNGMPDLGTVDDADDVDNDVPNNDVPNRDGWHALISALMSNIRREDEVDGRPYFQRRLEEVGQELEERLQHDLEAWQSPARLEPDAIVGEESDRSLMQPGPDESIERR